MNKKRITVTALLFLFVVFTNIAAFRSGKASAQTLQKVQYVSYSELSDGENLSEKYILYIGRSSCRFCAVVSGSLHKFENRELPIYILDLEEYRGQKEYEEIKKKLKFEYMPCFKYYENGVEKYHMNNPLSETYFEDGTNLTEIREQMYKKIAAFIDGACGTGEIINEEPQSRIITGKMVERGE